MLSEPLPITHGVPQGSILGPALFNIYINDLPLIPTIGSLESFVDDSKLFISFPIKNIDVVTAQLTEDLRKIAAWCCTNCLLINPEKTKLLLLGMHQILNKVPGSFGLEILGKQLYPSSFAKDLGVTIDASLTFDEHVTNLVSSCTGILCQINRAKYLLDKQTVSIVINALVLTPILKELNWFPVHLNVKLRESVTTFKCVKSLAPSYLCDKFVKRSDIHSNETRNKDKLQIPMFKSSSGQRTFHYRAVTLWNSMSADLRKCESVDNFTKKLHVLVFDQFYLCIFY